VQETEISQMEESDFFLEIDFCMNKTLHQHWWSWQLSLSEEKF